MKDKMILISVLLLSIMISACDSENDTKQANSDGSNQENLASFVETVELPNNFSLENSLGPPGNIT